MNKESAIFFVKTTANQERSVANMMAQVARKEHFLYAEGDVFPHH